MPNGAYAATRLRRRRSARRDLAARARPSTNTKLALLIPLDLDKFQENYTAYPKVHSIKAMYFSIFLRSYLLAEIILVPPSSTLSSAKSIFY